MEGTKAIEPFAGADSRFSRICLELSYYRGWKRAAQLKAVSWHWFIMKKHSSFINKLIDKAKEFAEIEKGEWIQEGITYSKRMATIRLIVVLFGFCACILSWLIFSR